MQVAETLTTMTEFITLPSGRVLEVEHFGSGTPILVLPGLGCTTALFSLILPELYHIGHYIMVNPRGMGASDRVEEEYEVADLAIDALFVMSKLGFDAFHVIGVSFGGFIAQELYELTPQRFLSLTLICSTGAGTEFLPLPELKDEDLERFYELDPRVRAELSVKSTVHPGLQTENPSLFQEIVSHRTHPSMESSQVIYQNHAAKAFLKGSINYQNFRCPTLIISGTTDRFVPVENALRLQRHIPGAKLLLIDNADHLVVLEKPVEVAQGLRQFWEAL